MAKQYSVNFFGEVPPTGGFQNMISEARAFFNHIHR